MARSIHATAPVTNWPDYEQRRVELVRLTGQHDEVRAELGRHEACRRDAEAEDRRAYAAALRSGKPDPGTKHFSAWEATARELRRRLDALTEAIARVEEEMTETVRQHEPGYRGDALRAAEQRRAAFAEAVEAVIEAREAWVSAREAELLLDVILSGEGRPHSARRNRVVGFIAPNGEPYSWEVLATALRADAAPERPKPVVTYLREQEL